MIIPNRKSANGKYRSISGTYIPINKDKYMGDRSPIFKSKLERSLMAYLDKSPAIIKWSYEKIVIKYKDLSSAGKVRRYYIDFVAIVRVNSTTMKKVWIEVKSKRETSAPKRTARKKERNYKLEEATYVKNQCKWDTARKVASDRGYEFLILTEDQLKR